MSQKTLLFLAGAAIGLGCAAFGADLRSEYRLLATNKTSTMQKEIDDAAAAGFRYRTVMGGETSFGGSEVVVIMWQDPEKAGKQRYQYRLLATSKTSTMQRELQEAGDQGFEYRGQTVFNTAFGGEEVVIILERDREQELRRYKYTLLATKKISTMQKELSQAGEEGFELVGMTVGKTAFGGSELVSILRTPMDP